MRPSADSGRVSGTGIVGLMPVWWEGPSSWQVKQRDSRSGASCARALAWSVSSVARSTVWHCRQSASGRWTLSTPRRTAAATPARQTTTKGARAIHPHPAPPPRRHQRTLMKWFLSIIDPGAGRGQTSLVGAMALMGATGSRPIARTEDVRMLAHPFHRTNDDQRHHLRFHMPHAHLASVFGDDWFAVKAEGFARFFGTPAFLVIQTIIVVVWMAVNVVGLTHFDIY